MTPLSRRRPRRTHLAAATLLVTGLATAACSAPGAGADASEDNSLVIAMAQDIDTADTHNTTAISTEAVMVNLQSYLLKRDEQGTPQPHLATSFESTDDFTWRFELRDGVTFHNGEPLTADDVKFTLERVALDNTLIQHTNYKTIQEVRVIDDTTFDIITNVPDPALPYRLAREGAGIFPQDYITEQGWDAYEQHPIGSGPYEFVEWVKGDHFTLQRYEDYFEGADSDWETVEFRTVSEPSTRIGELLAGSVDIADQIPVVDRDRVESNDGTHLVSSDSTTVRMLYVNQNDQFKTSDPRVVQAIDYAIDNEQLSEIFTGGMATPVRSRVVPGAFGHEPSLYDTYRYDPAKARELLQEAGYGDGELEITLTSSQGRTAGDADTAQTIQGMLEAVGIKVNIELLEASTYVDTRTTGKNKELLFTGWNNTLFDASLPLSHFRSTYAPNSFGYNNPEVDRLLDAAAINLNKEERATQYQQVQKIVAEEMPYIYLYQDVAVYGANDSIAFEPRMDDMYYVQDIELSTD